MAAVFDLEVKLTIDWQSIDANSAAVVSQIYRECAKSGLCGLVETWHSLLLDIDELFTSEASRTNLSEITVRYVDYLPDISVETSIGALLAQKTATWAVSIQEGQVIYDRTSLPIWNIRCILRQASVALASFSSTWNVKFDIEANTFENIPYTCLLKLFATDIRHDLEYTAACYRSMLQLTLNPDRIVLKAAIARSKSGIEMIDSTIIISVALYQDAERVWRSELGVDRYLEELEETQQRSCYVQFEYAELINQTRKNINEYIEIDMPLIIERDIMLDTISHLSHRSMSDLLNLGKYVLKRFVDDVSANIKEHIRDFCYRYCIKVGNLHSLHNGLWCLANFEDIQNGKICEDLLLLVSHNGVRYFELKSKTCDAYLIPKKIIGAWYRHPNAPNGVPEKPSSSDIPNVWVHQHDIYIITYMPNVNRLLTILSKTYALDKSAVTKYLEQPISNPHPLSTAADLEAIRLSEVFIELEQSLTLTTPRFTRYRPYWPYWIWIDKHFVAAPSSKDVFRSKLWPFYVHVDRYSLAAFASKHALKQVRFIEDLGYALESTLNTVKEHLDIELDVPSFDNMPYLNHRNILLNIYSMRIAHMPDLDKTSKHTDVVDIKLLSERDILINVVGVPALDGERYNIPTFVSALKKSIYVAAVVRQGYLKYCKKEHLQMMVSGLSQIG